MSCMNGPTRPLRMAAARVAVTVAFGILLSGCFSETYQRGYIVPEGALEQLPIGSTQEQVLIVLGTPTTVSRTAGSLILSAAPRRLAARTSPTSTRYSRFRRSRSAMKRHLRAAVCCGVGARRILPPLRGQRQCASTASNNSATILVILIIGLTAGPAVSL